MVVRNGFHSCSTSVVRHVGIASLAIAIVFAALATPARADSSKGFRAARLTYIEGDVRVEEARSSANSVAALNMPLVEGTVISSGEDGQAEIEFEDGSLVRITPNSGLSLVNLSVDSSGVYQSRISLLGGLAYLELRAGTRYQYSVDVGGDVISPIENATIRVNFDEPPAVIAILDGTAHVAASGGSKVDASAGQTVRIDAASEGGVYMIKQAIAPESWDRWNEDRDEAAADQSASQTDVRSKYAGSQGYGWSDLDANGTWYDVPGHGKVWQPDVAAQQDQPADGGQPEQVAADQTVSDQSAGDADQSGFDPYGYGSWAWTPAGYSWASSYSWGWIPYRCGQWSYWDGFGWGWTPGFGCSVFGFGGYGYGYSVNILVAPRLYRRPGRPVPGPGPIHPIIGGVHHGLVPVPPSHRVVLGSRIIAGNPVQAIEPVAATSYTARAGSLGAALRRDYPIDTKTHTPVTGLISTTHASPIGNSNARAAWQPIVPENRLPTGNYTPRPYYIQQQSGNSRSAPAQRSSPPAAPRAAPAPAPAHSAPASSSSHGK